MNYPKATYNPESQLAKTARAIVERQNAERKAEMDAKLEAINAAQEKTRAKIAAEKEAHEAAIKKVANDRAVARLDSMKSSARRAFRGSDEAFAEAWERGGLREAVINAATVEEVLREKEQIARQASQAMNIFNGKG